jgi:hypothetical protein
VGGELQCLCIKFAPVPPKYVCVHTNVVRQVYSPFELSQQQPASIESVEAPGVSVVDWETLDQSVWSTCKSLLLLQPDVVEGSMGISFCMDQHAKDVGSLQCSRLCEIKSSSEKDKKNAVHEESQKIGCPSSDGIPLLSVDLRLGTASSSEKPHSPLLESPARLGEAVQPPVAAQTSLE